MTEWRAVPGYEGSYEVSQDGRVRSVARKVPYGRHGRTVYQGRELRLARLKIGYDTVKLSLAGRARTAYVHELVLRAFVGPRPETEARGEIRHLDGNKTNNHIDNLKYGTINENAADRVRHRSEK